MGTQLDREARSSQLMRRLGWMLYATASIGPLCHPGVRPFANPGWVVAYIVLGIAFYRPRGLATPVAMTVASIAMGALIPCPFGALTLALVASQVALVVPPIAAIAWVVAQTAVLAPFLISALGWSFGTSELLAVLGFQAFVVATVTMQTRLALATRMHERSRIARDLHDALGHSLTALGLQLEIAAHFDEPAARLQLAKAREVTARLLGDVREVVNAMRVETNLLSAIRALVVDAPGLRVHLDVPPLLVVEEARRADCVVRCVQEIVTNTRRHADAQNLWIRVRDDAGELLVEAHDDGHGVDLVHGLWSMRSRMEEMGGRLEVTPAPFAISARLPLRGDA